MKTIDEGREWLRKRRDMPDGAMCPCCDQFVKRYKRTLNRDVAHFVLQLCIRYKQTGTWVNYRDLNKIAGGDYAKSKYWNLAETGLNIDPKKRMSGLWRPTLKGIQFVREELEVPRFAFVYDGKVEALGGTPIGIREALGKRFNYERLMLGVEL